jgi:hypothetical protein
LLTKGAFTSIEALGKSEQLHPKVIRKTIALAYLSPAMTASILRGEVPPSTTLTSLIEGNGMHWDPPSRAQR